MSDESAATLGPDGATVPAATSSPRASAFVEPPLSDELPETYIAKRASAILLLLDAHVKHAKRDAVTHPFPVFPIDPPAA